MSLLSQASLIVTPNGYKEGKLYSVIPSDGSGDLSVTRATTATRVNSQGLVELVPYNLLSYSEQIDNGYWSKYQSTITANATTAPDGTLTADRLNQTGPFSGNFYVTPSAFNGGLVSLSCFYKKGIGNVGWLEINRGAESCYIQFNLDTQVISASGYYVSTNIESVGNGWYRCSVVSNQSAGTANYVGFGNIGNNGDTIFAWGAQLNEGTIKDYQKTETRLNIPRLDYSNGTCPSILVEPQRTNLARWSSSFDNSAWTGLSFNATVTANDATAPDGTLTADKVVFGTGGYLYQEFVVSGLASATISIYSKTSTQQIVFGGATPAGTDVYSYVDVGNGWYRQLITRTFTSGGTGVIQFLPFGSNQTLYFWGAQLELASYATSYIPTTSASVTRNADVISKTGISSLIGQTEGTFFLDMYYDGVSSNFVLMQTFQNASQFNVIQLYLNSFKRLAFEVGNDGAILSPNSLVAGRYKMAGAYKNNDFVLYLNGDLIGTDTSGAVIATDAITFNDYFALPSIYKQVMEINSAALWKTRLTNAQLAKLTTI